MRAPQDRYYNILSSCKEGKIEILKIGGKTLVDADALDEAIENQEVMRYGR